MCEGDDHAHKKYFRKNSDGVYVNYHQIKLAFYIYTCEFLEEVGAGPQDTIEIIGVDFQDYYHNFEHYRSIFIDYFLNLKIDALTSKYYNVKTPHYSSNFTRYNNILKTNFYEGHTQSLLHILKVMRHYKFNWGCYYSQKILELPASKRIHFIIFLNDLKPLRESSLKSYIDEVVFNGEYSYFEHENSFKYVRDNGLTTLSHPITQSTVMVIYVSHHLSQVISYMVYKKFRGVAEANEVIEFIRNTFSENFSKDGNYIHNILKFIDGLEVGVEMPLLWQFELIF